MNGEFVPEGIHLPDRFAITEHANPNMLSEARLGQLDT